MKKLLSGAAALLMVLGMTACGGKKTRSVDSFDDTKLPEQQTALYGEGICFLGPDVVRIGGEQVVSWSYSGAANQTFEAASLRDVAELDVSLAEKLEKANVASLYIKKDIELGIQGICNEKKGFYDGGTYKEADLVYGGKVGQWITDEVTGAKQNTTWVPSPECYVDSLTPKAYWTPSHTETKDEHELDHNANPMVIQGAGTYTYVVARYSKTKADGSVYGMGVIQQSKGTEYVAPTFANWRLVGTISGWDKDATTANLQFNANNELTYHFEASTETAAVEFQVIKAYSDGSGSWGGQLGASAVTSSPAGAFDLSGSNIKVLVAGDYKITVNGGESGTALTIVAA